MVWLALLFVLFVLQIITVLVVEFRHPGKTVAWLIIMIVFPLVGFVLYYFLAREYNQRRKMRRRSAKMPPETRVFIASLAEPIHDRSELPGGIAEGHPRLFDYLSRLPDAPITRENTASVYTDGEQTYTAMLEAMEQATDHIHVQFYTIRSDKIGQRFQQLWIRKANAGVKVRVIYDGVGSYQMASSFIKELTTAGVEMCSFFPPLIAFFDKRINFRNHRKIIVVDGMTAFIGGINIGEEYVGGNARLGFWRDTHIQLRGDSVYYIQHLFMSDWALASGKPLIELPKYYPRMDRRGSEATQIIASGPDKQWDAILEMFFVVINSAKQSVYITTPYFIPDNSIAMALKTAAASGLDVRIIFPHTPDSRIVHWASLSYIEEMMQAGVKCYMYTKGFIHAKVIIIDQVIATVGTTNMDMRSFFSNFELNAILFDGKTVQKLEQDFLEDLKHSIQLDLETVDARSALYKIREIGARLLSPLL